MPPQEPGGANDDDGHEVRQGRQVVNPCGEPHAKKIDNGQHDDRGGGDQAALLELQMHTQDGVGPQHVIGRQCGHGLSQEKRDCDGHGCECCAVARREQHPAVQERGEASVRLAHEHVLTAGFGKHRAQFRAGEAGHERDAAGDHPKRQRNGGNRNCPHDIRGHDEDRRPDGARHHEHDRVEQSQPADQMHGSACGLRVRRSSSAHQSSRPVRAPIRIVF